MAVLVSHTRTWAESADLYFPDTASYTSVTSSLCIPSLEWSWDTAKLLGHILITHGPPLKLAVTLGGVAFMGQMNKDTGWWLHNRIPHTSSHPWTPPQSPLSEPQWPFCSYSCQNFTLSRMPRLWMHTVSSSQISSFHWAVGRGQRAHTS